MRRISLLNLKGGVGKTTCSVNLAGAAALRGLPTLLLDLDPQSSATDHLLEHPGGASIADVLMGNEPLRSVSLTVHEFKAASSWLKLVPSGGFQLSAAEVALQARASKNRLRKVLEGGAVAIPKLKIIIIDTGPGLDFLWYNALYASDVVLCPVELQMTALQGLRRFRELLEFAREEDGLEPEVYYVPTNNDGRLRESRELLAVLHEQFGLYPEGKTLPSIRYSSALSKAYAQRQTIFEFAPNDRAVEDYLTLVDVVLSL